MDNVQFEESSFTSSNTSNTHKGLIGLLFRYNIVSTEAQAQRVLIGIFVVVLLITAFVLFSGGSSAPAPVPIDATTGMPGQMPLERTPAMP